MQQILTKLHRQVKVIKTKQPMDCVAQLAAQKYKQDDL